MKDSTSAVTSRFIRSARWKPKTADHVLQLRAHYLSDRFVEALVMGLPKPMVVRRAA